MISLQDITLCQDATLTNDLLRQQADDVAVLSYSLEATRFQLTDNLHNLQRTVEDVSFHQVALEARSNDANRAIAAALEVLRNEIRNQAPAIIDGILNTTSLRRLDWLQAVAETLPAILERATSHLDVQTQLTPLAFRSLENPSIAHRPPDESILYQSRTTTNHGTRNPLTSATLSEVQFYMSQTPRHSASHVSRIHQKSSTHNLFVGIIRLCIRRTITDIVEKNADSIVRKPFQSTTLVSLEFQPSQHLLRRGITIRFTRKTKTYGSPTTSAALTTFHTIPSDSPVFASIDENDRFSLQQLLESRQASLFDRDTSGNSLLHIAALKSSADTCEYLVSLGADPLLPNDAGRTALDLAMTRSVDVGMLEGTFEGMVEEVARRIGIFKIFIKAEVDFSEWDNTKWFARHECLPWKQQRRLNSTELRVLGELIPFLNKIGAQPMHRGKIDTHGLGACDSVYTMQVLLSDEKTDADIRDEDKRNALHLLAGRIEFNDCGWQKLTTAQIDFCYTAKVAILIEAGCRLHGVDMHGRTPTRLAIECGNSKRWSDGLANAGLTLADVVFEDDRLFPTKGVVEEVLEDFFRLDEPFD